MKAFLAAIIAMLVIAIGAAKALDGLHATSAAAGSSAAVRLPE